MIATSLSKSTLISIRIGELVGVATGEGGEQTDAAHPEDGAWVVSGSRSVRWGTTGRRRDAGRSNRSRAASSV